MRSNTANDELANVEPFEVLRGLVSYGDANLALDSMMEEEQASIALGSVFDL